MLGERLDVIIQCTNVFTECGTLVNLRLQCHNSTASSRRLYFLCSDCSALGGRYCANGWVVLFSSCACCVSAGVVVVDVVMSVGTPLRG